VIVLGQFLLPNLHARVETNFYDRVLRAADSNPSTRVVLVQVDGPSIERLGPLPWPTDIHAALINRLREAGARVVAFTTPLTDKASERERMQAAVRMLESHGGDSAEERRRLRELLGDAKDKSADLAVLATAMSTYGRVVLPLPLLQSDKDGEGDLVPGDARLVVGSDLLHTARQSQAVRAPPGVLSKAALSSGHTLLAPDQDGVVRHDFTAVRVGTVLVPSLGTAIAMTALQVPSGRLRFEDANTLALGQHRFALENELGQLYRPLRASQVEYLSYQQVLERRNSDEQLRDAIVLVRPTNAANEPTVTTPLGTADESLVLAGMAVSLIDGTGYRHTSASWIAEVAAALTVIAVAAFALPALGATTALLVAALIAGALLVSEFAALASAGLWLQLVLPILALGAALIIHFGWRAIEGLASGRAASPSDGASLRSLGQTFHKQGQLDLAFETFRRCPMDATTMELLYALGSDYERRHQYPKALAVYSYMGTHDAGFRDLRARRAQVIRRGTEHQKQLSPQKLAAPALAEAPSLLDPAMVTWPPIPASTSTPRASNRTLGRYEIDRELGKGAMGVVYLGRDPKINRIVAIKAIPLAEEFQEEDLAEARARFFREAEMAGRLNHPAIVTVYDAGEDQGLAYIAMEYLRGQHLSHFADPARLLPPKTVMMLAARTAEALHYAHRQNVVHRDIKPANIMFNPDTDELKITDFGIARLTDTSRTKTGIVLGTPSFMSPEQLEGRSLDGRSDLFALGVSLYQLLAGQLPFRADSMPRLMHKIATEPHSPIDQLRPELPACIVGIVDKALAKSPEARYQTGAELAAALRACAQSEDVQW
jgi:eukaryotic-like serine/threonine-protein kinase